jgi:hypothetical protein
MFVESLRRLPAADAAANAMWGSDVLLRDDLARRRKAPNWELRWLWVFPQLPVETVDGLAQAIVVYKSPGVRRPSAPLGLSTTLTDKLAARRLLHRCRFWRCTQRSWRRTANLSPQRGHPGSSLRSIRVGSPRRRAGS